MPLEKIQVATNQRTDKLDMNRATAYALANLALAARHLIVDAGRVLRGGALRPADPPTRFLTLEPLAALSANGELILLENDYALPEVAPNSSGNPRIDLVSIGYAEADSRTEQRTFIDPLNLDPVTGKPIQYQAATPTTITATPEVTLTTGTPAASPSPPPTPANHIALWQIAVANGATQLTASELTRVEAERISRLRGATFMPTGNPQTSPYTSPALSLVVPTAGAALLIAQFTLKRALTERYTVDILRDGSALDIGGRSWAAEWEDTPLDNESFSVLAAGLCTSPGLASFTVKITGYSSGGGGFGPFIPYETTAGAHFLVAVVP